MNRIFHTACTCNITIQRTKFPCYMKKKNNVYEFLRCSSSLSRNGFRFTHVNNTNVSFKKPLQDTCKRNNHDRIINVNPKGIRLEQKRFFSIFSHRDIVTKHKQFNLLQTVSASNTTDHQKSLQFKHKTVLIYLTAVAIAAVGLSYAAVPLYRIYCQATGYGGTTQKADSSDEIAGMERIEDRPLTIRFEAATGKTLHWKFKPQQKEVILTPGETALAFYTAENLTDRPIIGISTYNVIPFDAGKYFNKIQCFCFEEQQLNPHEEVDMPVFFYIDPEFDEDPQMAKVNEIILSYTFFESSDGNVPISVPHTIR